MKRPLRKYDDARGFRRVRKGVQWVFLLSLVKILKDFNLTRSFKKVVNLDYTKRFARASATTTTTSTTTTCCESAASELLQALLRLFEA